MVVSRLTSRILKLSLGTLAVATSTFLATSYLGFLNKKQKTLPPKTKREKTLTVAIVGAGPSGLVCAKNMLWEGLEPTVFEQSSQLGGTWRYVDSNLSNEYSSCYWSLKTISSKYEIEFIDFPFKTLIPFEHPHHTKVFRYLHDFASYFSLTDHIKFNTQVKSIRRNPDDQNSWQLTLYDRKTDIIYTRSFDAVAICTGLFSSPKYKFFPNFKGTQIHSRDYKRPQVFQNQRICIIGSGASGLGIAHDISKYASSVYVSSRRTEGIWKDVGNRLIHVPGIQRVEEGTNKLVFDDGTEFECDVIIHCTGYDILLPEIENLDGVPVEPRSRLRLYKHVFPIGTNNLAFIGFVSNPGGTLNYISDLQSRWAAKVFLKELELPSADVMYRDVDDWELRTPSGVYDPMKINQRKYIKTLKCFLKMKS